jgi:hypothetical protein
MANARTTKAADLRIASSQSLRNFSSTRWDCQRQARPCLPLFAITPVPQSCYPIWRQIVIVVRSSRGPHGLDRNANRLRCIGGDYCLDSGLGVRRTTIHRACCSQSALCQRRNRPGRIRRKTQTDRPVRASDTHCGELCKVGAIARNRSVRLTVHAAANGCFTRLRLATTSAEFGSPRTARAIASFVAR